MQESAAAGQWWDARGGASAAGPPARRPPRVAAAPTPGKPASAAAAPPTSAPPVAAAGPTALGPEPDNSQAAPPLRQAPAAGSSEVAGERGEAAASVGGREVRAASYGEAVPARMAVDGSVAGAAQSPSLPAPHDAQAAGSADQETQQIAAGMQAPSLSGSAGAAPGGGSAAEKPVSAGLLNGNHGVGSSEPVEAPAAAEAGDILGEPAEQRVRAPQRLSRPSLSGLFPGFRTSSLGVNSGGQPIRGGPPQLAKFSLPAMPSSPREAFPVFARNPVAMLLIKQACSNGDTVRNGQTAWVLSLV